VVKLTCVLCVCVYVVLYCTLLAQAQSDADRQKITKQMESDAELLTILRQLQETDKEDIVHEERERRQAARKSRVEMDLDAMDTDLAGVWTFALFTDLTYLLNSTWPSLCNMRERCQSARKSHVEMYLDATDSVSVMNLLLIQLLTLLVSVSYNPFSLLV